MLNKLNVLKFIGENIGSLLSVTLIVLFIGSIGLNGYFMFFDNNKSINYSEKIKEFEQVEDSLEVYINILSDSIKLVVKNNKTLLKNRNKIQLALTDSESKLKLIEEDLEKIRNLKKLNLDKKLTNEEIDIWLFNKFGSSK